MNITNSLFALALLAMSTSASALEIHVAVNGNDANPGTHTSPLATITAARDALRISGKLGEKSCTVVMGEGVYRLSAPITFTPADSGSEGAPVVYRAAEGASVTFTGAQEITTTWESWKDGIYRTQVGEMDAVDQLFVNQSRQILARYPDMNADYIQKLDLHKNKRGKIAGNVPYDGCADDAWHVSRSKGWADPTGGFMHGMHGGLWGSQHYIVTSQKADGSLIYEGGWQNNRARPPHPTYHMIENVFEELDSAGEWYHDTKGGWLYYKPAKGVDMVTAKFEAVLQIRHLIEFYGSHKTPVATMDIRDAGNGLKSTIVKTYETTKPVQHIKIEGIRFTGTARTFMDTIEPLLRSDWSIYRGGAIHLRGTENISIENCLFEEVGGNAVFVDHYNRGAVIRSNQFRRNGASDVVFAGSFAAVRDPEFSYGAAIASVDEMDSVVGPKSDEYPADCLVEDNLMTLCGRVEKQVAGVNLSMSSRITIRHNTISHTPRAAINVCDGTWGGHLIEWNDCFETVLETHDHGAFNSWGRDRIWHTANPAGPGQRDKDGKALISYYIDKYPNSPQWDAYQTTIIRNNRMQCDHGWDIDLDDGSTNYEIYDNLCLSGGLKTREGYNRIVTNNVVMGGYTCNVPYPKPTHDVFERNIVAGLPIYKSSNPRLWGGVRDYTFVHNPTATQTEPAVALQKQTLDDAHSLYGNAKFIAPEKGDFTVAPDSPALKIGFKNIPMSGFGVTSEALKSQAGTPPLRMPDRYATNEFKAEKAVKVLGANVRSLNSLADISATGMNDSNGAYLVDVPADSQLAKYGFRSGDVVLFVNGKIVPNAVEFVKVAMRLPKGVNRVQIWRNQAAETVKFQKE
jgi:hypothetical protein